VVGSLSKIRTWTPKDIDTLAKIELLLKRADFPRWYCPPSWAFLRAGSSHYVNHLYAIELKATVIPKEVGNIQSKWMNSGMKVDDKGNKQWVWLAMDTKTREVIGCHIGDRSSKSALALWDSLQAVSIANVPRFIPITGKPMP